MAEDLTSGVLRDVSRSFYLTIRVLPQAMREPVGLAYLLARASDTLADSAHAPAAQRMEWLRQFEKVIAGEESAAFSPEAETDHPGERVLLERLPECVARQRALAPADREAVRQVLHHIIAGQTLDVERFGQSNPPNPPLERSDASRCIPRAGALPDAVALERYTYLVAGCVGEFWTETAFRHVRDYSRSDPAELRRLGVEFGQGLQLVNILRDLREDLQNHRCYLPADALAAAGLSPAEALRQPERAGPVVEQWLARAEGLLASGAEYVGAVRPRRLRLAVFLPWYLGVKTLALLRKCPALTTTKRVKVSRADVRRALWLGMRCSLSDQTFQRIKAELSPRASAR